MARQPGEVAAVEFPLDALLQSPHHIPLGIGGGVAENPHVAAPAEVLAVDEVGSDDPLDLVALAGAQPGRNQAERESAVRLRVDRRDGNERRRRRRGRGRRRGRSLSATCPAGGSEQCERAHGPAAGRFTPRPGHARLSALGSIDRCPRHRRVGTPPRAQPPDGLLGASLGPSPDRVWRGYHVTEWSAPNDAKPLRGAPRRDPWSLYTI